MGHGVILKRSILLAKGRELLECVGGEADWSDDFVVQSGGRWRHVRGYVGPVVGFRSLFEEVRRGTWLSGVVQRYHDSSLLGVIGERVQAIRVSHGDVCDPNAGGTVEAWKDF